MPKTLEQRLTDLEAMVPVTDEGVLVVHLVGIAPDGEASKPPPPITRQVFGALVRAEGETEAEFVARLVAMPPTPAGGGRRVVVVA